MSLKNTTYLVVLSTLLGLTVTSCSEDREQLVVKKQQLVEAVYSSVVIEPSELYTVNASVAGYIDEIPVLIGDSVEVNDVLFMIRDVQSNATASNAKLAYDIAQRNYSGDLSLLEDMKLEIENAKLKRSNDSVNYSRNKKLFEENVITQVELEQTELLFKSSKNAHASLVNRLKRTEKELRSSLAQARNNYESSRSRSDDAIIRNKINGVVYDIMKEPGELVTMQQPVAIIGSANKFKIKMLIDEVDITKVKIGQNIIVALEAYNDQVFDAKVTHISPKMDERTQTFEIVGEFTTRPEKLYMGLTGEANIVISERSETIAIPREYLIDNNSVETSSGIVMVETGIKSLSHIEILKGIKPGDIIYKPE